MKFKDFEISQDSVLQSLADAGFDFEEYKSDAGAVMEINGSIIPVPKIFSPFDNVNIVDESVSIVKYVFEISNENFLNDTTPTYRTKLHSIYSNSSMNNYADYPAA